MVSCYLNIYFFVSAVFVSNFPFNQGSDHLIKKSFLQMSATVVEFFHLPCEVLVIFPINCQFRKYIEQTFFFRLQGIKKSAFILTVHFLNLVLSNLWKILKKLKRITTEKNTIKQSYNEVEETVYVCVILFKLCS